MHPEAPAPEDQASFYQQYIHRVAHLSREQALLADCQALRDMSAELGEERGARPYAPGKWSPKDAVLHCADTERIFTTRALMIARGEQRELPGFDHEAYAKRAEGNTYSWQELLEQCQSVRAASQSFFHSLRTPQWALSGIASGRPIKLRSFPYVISGHYLHHLAVIERHLAPGNTQ